MKKRYFNFYNWQHKDITVTLSMKKSSGTMMYQRTGQRYYTNNIFTAIPYSPLNAAAIASCEEDKTTQINIKGSDCFSCWYFLVIEIQDPTDADFRLTITQNEERISG